MTHDHGGSNSHLVCSKGQAPDSKAKRLVGAGNHLAPGTAHCHQSLINYGNKLVFTVQRI